MNLALRQLEEEESRGWFGVGDKWVCPDHVEDQALKRLLIDNAASSSCAYCDREEPGVFAAPVDLLVERIATSLAYEWASADDEGVGWEGGYVNQTWDTWQLITEVIDPPLSHGDLISDVVGALPDHAWVQRNFYHLSGSDRLKFGWEHFAQIVKHRNRYFFWDYRASDLDRFDDRNSLTPGELLSAIGEVVVAAGLIRSLSPGEILYRTRAHSGMDDPSSARELGAPPAESVLSSGRMNPAGVSLLYAALDRRTSELEAREANPMAEAFSLAEFEPMQTVRLVDLSLPPPVPSLFDDTQRHLRPSLIFLRHFVAAIAEPFVHDERIHLSYVPTQVVTEWLASRFSPPDGPVHGVLYSSARTGRTNAALFVDNEGMCDPGDEDSDALFELKRSERLSS